MNFIKREYVLVAVIFLAGIGLNLFLTAYTTFWSDESIAVNFSYQSNSSLISDLLTKESHPPVYYFLIKITRIIFGDKESYFRLLSSLFFILTGFYIYLLGREIDGKSSGLISLALWSSNFFLLFYSKQARPYSMAVFFSSASIYYLWMLLKNRRAKYAAGYIIVTVLGLYSDYWFVLLVFTQFIVLLIVKEKDIKAWSVLIGTSLLFAPWGIIYLLKFNDYGGTQWIGKSGLATVWESLGYFGWVQWWVILPGIIGGIVGAVINNNLNSKKLWFLLVYFFAPIGSALAVSQFVPIYTAGRREIILVPIFIVAMAYLFSRIENKKWQIGISVLLVFFTLYAIVDFNVQAREWRSSDLSVIKEVKNEIKSGDYVILYGLTNSNFNYYARRLGMNNNKIYFPPDMELNNNSLSSVYDVSQNKDKLDASLNILKDRISKIDHANFFVFTDGDIVASSTLDFLDSNLKRVKEITPQSPHMPTWINRVMIYEK